MDANTIIAAKDRRSGVAAANGVIDFSQLMILVVDAVPSPAFVAWFDTQLMRLLPDRLLP